MTDGWKCPFCGATHDGENPFDAAVEPWPDRDEGKPAPHVLYAETGGGEPYRRAMIQHGYVIVNADVRCGAPNGPHACLLKKGHDGPHLGTLGEWTS